MKKILSFKLNDLSIYRAQLMGIATLMIIICHASASYVTMPAWLDRLLDLGNYGVDIFLLLSGLGCYYSIKNIGGSKFHEREYAIYYKRRFFRIYIPYLIIYIPYCFVLFSLNKYSIGDCVLCIMTLEFWLFHRGAWFVSLIIVLYLLSPFFYHIMESRAKWPIVVSLIAVIIVLCNLPTHGKSEVNVLSNIQFAFCRTPCFLLGMALGCSSMEKKTISVWWLVLMATGVIIERKITGGGTMGMAWAIVPLIVYILIILVRALQRFAKLDATLTFLGKISLESYLTNITIKSLFVILIPAYFDAPIFNGRYLQYAIVVIAGLLFAYLTNVITIKIQRSLMN